MMQRLFDNGFYGNGRCPGMGFFHNEWSILIGIGVIITITLLFYLFVHNKKKMTLSDDAFESLKMKYVQGDISEEEYLRRKKVIGR